MKRICLLSILTGCVFLKGFAQSFSKKDNQPAQVYYDVFKRSGPFDYTLTTMIEPYAELSEAISVNNGETWDDPEYFIPLEFPFKLNGNLIVYLEWHGAGFQLRSSTAGGEDTYVIPFEADLIDRGISEGFSLSPIRYKVEGEPGDRIIKIEMKNAGSHCEFMQSGTTNMFINLQLWLYEYTDIVEFRFGENSITNPFSFYGCYGGNLGITDIDRSDSTTINPHFLQGPATSPILGTESQQLVGIPTEGTVYRLAPITPVQVEVIENNSTSFCHPNGIAIAIPVGGVAPFTFLWSTGDTTSSLSGLDDGVYSVTVTDHLGDWDTETAFITNVNPIAPNVSSTLETDVDANDGTATSSASGGAPPYSFVWSNGEMMQTIDSLVPATYTVTVTDSEGCTGTQSVIVNHFGCFDIIIDVYVTDASCAGVCDATIQVSATGGSLPYTYTLSEGSGGPGMCAGTYYLTVTDADGCGNIEGPILIIEPNTLAMETGSTKETAPFANDGTAWVIPIEGTPPFFYEWSNGSLDPLITGLVPGSYAVTVTDVNGCSVTETVVVEAFGCSAYTESFIERDDCIDSCSWRITTLLVNSVGPLVYTWSTGENGIGIQNKCPGTYALTIVDEGYGDCTYMTAFTISPPESITGVVDEVIHVTDTTTGAIFITATGQNIYQYRWSGPNWYISWDEDISGLLPGFYSVDIKSHWGCFRIDSIEVKDLTVSTNAIATLDARIYPNPAKDQVLIDIEEESELRIQLKGMDGRAIKTWDAARLLDVSEIPAGLYLLEGVSEDGVFRKQLSILR